VIGVRGPFGNGFPIEKMKGKNILMIAGGTGISVIKSLIHHLLDKREEYGELRLLYGAKTPKDLVFRNTFLLNESEASKRGLTVTLTVDVPDEGWRGNVGTVVDLLHKTKVDPRNTIAVVCGPSVMMKVATEKLLGMGFDENSIIYSFERRMQCGIGICGHCMLGEKYVCLDGPIFTYAELRGVIERIF
jgi:NAD(P)H-flavin reductase